MLLLGLSWTFGALYATYCDDMPYYKVSTVLRGWAANLAGLPAFLPGFSIESLCEAIRTTKEDIYG